MPVLALDAGTTSTRAMLFGDDGAVLAQVQQPFTQHFPQDGWVEHDADELFDATVACTREALARAGLGARDLAAIGIAVQRETVVVWERATGRPIHRAIVWQDRRTADHCRALARDPAATALVARTGLLLDPYFSATKLAWILDHVAGARAAAERDELLAGTIDSWLLWRLTDGMVHATDATNASRTLLFDIRAQRWDDELCALFRVPPNILPRVRDSASEYGLTAARWLGGRASVRAVVGDQQAGAVGQECIAPGQAKATYGTGCFILVHTGDAPVVSQHGLLTTVALRLNGHPTYALEGSIFNAGTVIQWLRDELGLIATAAESADLAASISTSGGTFCVPAFTGLGAPWWDPEARAGIVGMTRDTAKAHVVRACLESVSLQTRDISTTFSSAGVPIAALRVDGGMSVNDWLMQSVADQLRVPVERPAILETTAWGAARLAGMQAGIYPALGAPGFRRVEQTFVATADPHESDHLHAGWLQAVAVVRSFGRKDAG